MLPLQLMEVGSGGDCYACLDDAGRGAKPAVKPHLSPDSRHFYRIDHCGRDRRRAFGREMYQLYVESGTGDIPEKLAKHGFGRLPATAIPTSRCMDAFSSIIGDHVMGDFWSADPPTDVVITAFDLKQNRSLFIKPWKHEYRIGKWPKVVLSSCTVPTYFPAVDGRYVDGGVGSYANPCYLAAYEAYYCLGWDPAETTLISLGTGRSPHHFKDGNRLWTWEWLTPASGCVYAVGEGPAGASG